MRIALVWVVLTGLVFSSSAQSGTIKIRKSDTDTLAGDQLPRNGARRASPSNFSNGSGIYAYDLHYGPLFLDFNPVVQATDATAGRASAFPSMYGLSVKTTGQGDGGVIWWKCYMRDITFTYNKLEDVTYRLTDTSSYRLTGYNFSMNIGKDLLHQSRMFDIIPYYGYQIGRLRLLYMENGTERKYTNPAFMFNFHVEARMNLISKRGTAGVGLSLKGGYYLDVSKAGWKKKDDGLIDLPGMRISAPYVQAMISVAIPD